ncbi:SDR family oxidoreductase [Sneathiella sp.]|jgi:citronellol/citronellal dehydrogenase|uniref:SDR family oxidoreductase n=1 Tax=Sneathiella sp. TaxID=1964365 RepID=UPI0039E48D66
MVYDSVFKNDLFSGQTHIVTGGGSGIGRCIAHELCSLGAKVVITGRSQDKLDTVAAEIREDGGTVDTEAFDIRSEETVVEKVAAILDRNGPVHGLVNNAGGQFPALLEDISLKGWEAVIRTNLTGGFLMSRELVRQSMSDNGGNIVNIVADFWNSMPRMGHSGAARAGMSNFTKTAAVEWAHYGIRVNAVAPGTIASSGLDTYDEAAHQRLHKRKMMMPMKRYGTEAEVSGMVVFLLSPAANFISGETIRIDGAVPNMTNAYQVPDHEKSHPFNGFHRAVDPEFMSRKPDEDDGD